MRSCAKKWGRKPRETVREKFLVTRYAAEFLHLCGTFDNNLRVFGFFVGTLSSIFAAFIWERFRKP
jgi:hypothetical protein